MSSSILEVDERNRILAEVDRIENVECGFPACQRDGHDHMSPTSKWRHQLLVERFDEGAIFFEINYIPGQAPLGYLEMHADREMTAAEMREMAVSYEKFPDLLRKYADLMDVIDRATAALSGKDETLTYVEFTEMAAAVDLAPSEVLRIAEKIRQA